MTNGKLKKPVDKNPASSQYRPCLRVLSWRSLLRRSCILTVLGLTREASVDRQRYYKTTLNLSRSTKSPLFFSSFDFFNVCSVCNYDGLGLGSSTLASFYACRSSREIGPIFRGQNELTSTKAQKM